MCKDELRCNHSYVYNILNVASQICHISASRDAVLSTDDFWHQPAVVGITTMSAGKRSACEQSSLLECCISSALE